ncbi:MAG: dihydroorotase [Alistipes sp.]|nr:dihydroorotase [Alistipes sp.]
MEFGKILLRGGLLVGEGRSMKGDILIENGVIADMGAAIEVDDATEVVDVEGCVVTYGLADVHVHLREPGFSAKETIASGTLAAAHGGFTTVCAMPNLSPAPDALDTLAVEQRMIDEQAVVEVLPYATITVGRRGEQTVDVEALKPLSCGFSDDGSGVQIDEVMLDAMHRVAAVDGIIAAHCEENALLRGGYIHDGEYAAAHGHKGICSESEWAPIARDVEMVAKTSCRYHVCHVSAKESVEIIRQAKRRGLPVTCETGPHYLVFSDADLQEDGRFKMNPPIRSAEDREALIKGIQDGTIECIATDHAPHTAEEKSKGLKGSTMGVVGLETAFAVTYTHLVRTGVVTLEKAVELLCDNPRRIFRLGGALRKGERADIAVFDVREPYKVDSQSFLSKGKATPFEGMEVYGRCVMTLYGGKAVWKE